jgi:F0F1-type ATP synthase assembly protein I
MNISNGMENNKNNNGIWWKPAFEIFSEISTWIAVPIILAVVAGKALDDHYGTKPWMLIGAVIIAFLISSYGMVKAVKNFTNKIKK